MGEFFILFLYPIQPFINFYRYEIAKKHFNIPDYDKDVCYHYRGLMFDYILQ
jgi:hypothetical protein